MAVDPSHPAAYRLSAATVWIGALFERGAVSAEDYLGQADPGRSSAAFGRARGRIPRRSRPRGAAGRGVVSEDGQRRRPLSARVGLRIQASYAATVEGACLARFAPPAARMPNIERVLGLDPARKDAGLIVGLYRYAVSSLSAAVAAVGAPGRIWRRPRARSAADRGRRRLSERRPDERALHAHRHLQPREAIRRRVALIAAAAAGVSAQPAALARSGQHGASRRTAGEAARRRSNTAWRWLASDPRPRAFGEVARWRYTYGAALVALKESTPPIASSRGLEDSSRAWVGGRIRMELGKLADLAGNRPGARRSIGTPSGCAAAMTRRPASRMRGAVERGVSVRLPLHAPSGRPVSHRGRRSPSPCCSCRAGRARRFVTSPATRCASSFASDIRNLVYRWDPADPRPEAERRQRSSSSCTRPTTARPGFRSRSSTAIS